MENPTFVRAQMLPPLPPPTRESGAVRWLHQNLFSSWFNGILTVISLAAVVWLVAILLPWWLNGVWKAGSLGECRTIIEANAGPGATGACWAMIRERWYQFIFGFYPPALWWRPILAFGLMIVAVAPVLYSGRKRTLGMIQAGVMLFLLITLALAGAPWPVFVFVVLLQTALFFLSNERPGALFIFTALYPAICFLLLWGGSAWMPVMAMVGFVILALVARLLSDRLGAAVAVGLGLVAATVWWLYLGGAIADAFDAVLPLGLEPVKSDQFGGFLLAIVIGVTAISCSLPIGIILALGRQSNMLIVKTLSVGFIEFIRGVPLITLLFTASLLLQYFLPPHTNFDIILRVIILVTFFSAAYLAEVIRGGLAALPRGQYEAADALGLDYWQAQRLIIMPQALKVSIPGIVSTFIGLFKDTTLVAFVGLMDPLKGVTQVVRADINWKGIYWEPYIFVGAIFFVICFGMSRYSMYLEGKLKTDHR